MVIQAGPILSNITGKFPFTSGQFQRQLNCLHQVLCHTTAAVGTVVGCAIIRNFTDHGDARINLPHVQPQIGIALVVLQQNVIFWHITLDKTAFQYQCLEFRRCNDHIKMINMADHQTRFGRMRHRVDKILADAVFQFFCLAHINDIVMLIPHDIHTGAKGERGSFFL